LSQPLNSTTDAVLDDDEDDVELAAARDEVAGEVVLAAGMVNDQGVPMQVVEKVVERIIERPMRKRLPDTRDSKTHHFNVAGHEGYLTVGMYQDGAPGELFITMSKEGSTIGGLMDSLGTAISVALQYGVPITSLVNKFAHQRFEPQGITTNKDIPFAKSLVDYIFRWMGMEFVDGYKEDNAPARPAAPVAVKEDTRWTGDGTATASDGVRPPSSITSDRGIDTTVKTDGQTEPVEEHVVVQAIRVTDGDMSAEAIAVRTSLSQSTATLQSDAPPCPDCGQITVRNGTCYRCHNCGASLGCS
jgi:ribonucleoside-diphosphate reductase alpha chain